MPASSIDYQRKCGFQFGAATLPRLRATVAWLPAMLAICTASTFFLYFIYLADGFPDGVEAWILGIGWLLNAEITQDRARHFLSIYNSLLATLVLGGIAFVMVVRAMRSVEEEKRRITRVLRWPRRVC